MSLVDFTQKTTEGDVILLKSKLMLDAYREFFAGKPIANILEYGTWEGGSPIFSQPPPMRARLSGLIFASRRIPFGILGSDACYWRVRLAVQGFGQGTQARATGPQDAGR